jgi:hypothetical protein
VEGRQAWRKGSLSELNTVARSLFLHFILHVSWSYVFGTSLKKNKLSREHRAGSHLSSIAAFG